MSESDGGIGIWMIIMMLLIVVLFFFDSCNHRALRDHEQRIHALELRR